MAEMAPRRNLWQEKPDDARDRIPPMTQALHIRSYSGAGALHDHTHAQLVLQMAGTLEIEVGGHGARLSQAVSAVIAPGERHAQQGCGLNRSLVLDLPAAALPEGALDRRFLPVPEAARRLVEFADLSAATGTLPERVAGPLLRLLLDSLWQSARPCPFARLEAAIRAEPARDWTVDRMARVAGMSRSALYRALAEARGTTPARLVTATRIALAQGALRQRGRSLAELAAELGFSDQAALTRAMRRETGKTPGAWRAFWGTPGP
ncbi:AraC family transcriptional regulator [Cereibacter sphaeroides]|uniref:AraC family transcriptional regulator n=2 Tax=Cereibacter sphaeroides TaxID=1063 RepID=A0AAX1UIJ6_CERSP|nr:AraC family transcriptional regulator [Cereibacter sphaeroides]